MVSRFCNRCGQLLPANATTCPRCNAPVAAAPSSTAAPGPASSAAGATPEATLSARRTCANCRAPMRWIGHYSLRATGPPGSGNVAPGGAVEAAETLLPFSLYYCQTCGKFDFYYPGT
ncbi:MAG TPA: hypothetical protein VEH10_03020 [Thermoplasmata archaeon]|nr:hypothetical protein [Thermoplasmata archaeon]